MPHFFVCRSCWTMVIKKELTDQGACPICRAQDFTTPSLTPWRLSSRDRKFLRSLRISAEDGHSLFINGSLS